MLDGALVGLEFLYKGFVGSNSFVCLLIVKLIHAFGNGISTHDFKRRNTNWVHTHTLCVQNIPGSWEVMDDVHHRPGPGPYEW